MRLSTDKSKELLNKYEKVSSKIRYLIRAMMNSSAYYCKKYVNSNLPPNKTLKLYDILIVV